MRTLNVSGLRFNIVRSTGLIPINYGSSTTPGTHEFVDIDAGTGMVYSGYLPIGWQSMSNDRLERIVIDIVLQREESHIN